MPKKYNGSIQMAHPVKATTDTLYDLASNTKMYATNFALQKLMGEGKLETARNMLADGMGIALVMPLTGLSEEQLRKITH